MEKTKSGELSTRVMVELAVLIAIVLLMSFTPLGYLNIGPLSITLLCIPVAVGAIHLGPKAGLVLGLVFGITSFVQCFGLSAFGTLLFSVNPMATFIICVVTRALMGWLCGLIYVGLSHSPLPKPLSMFIAALSAPVLNTVFFMSVLVLCFTPTLQNDFGMGSAVLPFLVSFVGINGVVEWISGCIVGGSVAIALSRAFHD